MTARRSMLRVLLGSFFIQSSWSFEKMQGLGFAAAIAPAIDDIYRGDDKPRRKALQRHLALYNAHPYMASPILGAVVRIEENIQRGECPEGRVARFKTMVMAPFSAVGDMFFWGAVRPLASSAAVVAAVFFGLWGAVVFAAVYNLFHLWMRVWGFKRGYELGTGVVEYIKSLNLAQWSVRVRYLTAAVLGAGCAMAALKLLYLMNNGPVKMVLSAGGALRALPVAAVALTSNLLFKRGVSITRQVYIFIPALIFYGTLIGWFYGRR